MNEKIAMQVEAPERRPEALLHSVHFRNVDEKLRELPRQEEPLVLQDAVRQMAWRNFMGSPPQMMVRVRMERGLETEKAMGDLWGAVKVWALSFRAMLMMPRAALAARGGGRDGD